MKVKFKTSKPKDYYNVIYIVSCPEYCSSGYEIATYNGEDWETDAGDTIFSDMVDGWCVLDVDD